MQTILTYSIIGNINWIKLTMLPIIFSNCNLYKPQHTDGSNREEWWPLNMLWQVWWILGTKIQTCNMSDVTWNNTNFISHNQINVSLFFINSWNWENHVYLMFFQDVKRIVSDGQDQTDIILQVWLTDSVYHYKDINDMHI